MALIATFVGGFGLILFLGILIASCNPTPSTSANSRQISNEGADAKVPEVNAQASKTEKPYLGIEVSADRLFSQYEDNEVSADQIFKGNLVLVTGKIGSINKDFLDKIYVVLPSQDNPFMGIHAELNEKESSTAAHLRRGQKVTLSCTGGGKIITEVVLKECTIQ